MDLWGLLLGCLIESIVFEDNQACIQILRSGKNATLRHLKRTHSISVAWLVEQFKNDPQLKLCYCDTADMCADIFTKAVPAEIMWGHMKAMGFESREGRARAGKEKRGQ